MSPPLYIKSSHLICLQKENQSLTFSHYGNVAVFNSFFPDDLLSLLQFLSKPRSGKELLKKFAHLKKKDLLQELQRLEDLNYVQRFQKTSSSRTENNILKYFVKNQHAVGALTKKIRKTRLGIYDLGNVSSQVRQVFSNGGFEKTSCLDPKIILGNGKSLETFIKNHDFFIVIASPVHKLQMSSWNQLMLKHKKQWLLLNLDLFGGIIGPCFGFEGGPCYDCLIDHSKRHAETVFEESQYVDLIESKGRSSLDFSNQIMAQNIFSYALIESIKILSQLSYPASIDGYYTFDMYNFRMTYNLVSPSPVCPVCSVHVKGRR